MVASSADIGDLLGVGKPSSRWQKARPALVWAGIGILIIAGATWWWASHGLAPAVHYQTVAAKTGNLVVTVSTTGTVDPINQVQVGSEISGTVRFP